VKAQPMMRFDIASSSGLFAFIGGHLRLFALNLPFPHRTIATGWVKKVVTQMNANGRG
jgi:hypothetical protein